MVLLCSPQRLPGLGELTHPRRCSQWALPSPAAAPLSAACSCPEDSWAMVPSDCPGSANSPQDIWDPKSERGREMRNLIKGKKDVHEWGISTHLNLSRILLEKALDRSSSLMYQGIYRHRSTLLWFPLPHLILLITTLGGYYHCFLVKRWTNGCLSSETYPRPQDQITNQSGTLWCLNSEFLNTT